MSCVEMLLVFILLMLIILAICNIITLYKLNNSSKIPSISSIYTEIPKMFEAIVHLIRLMQHRRALSKRHLSESVSLDSQNASTDDT